MYESSVRIQLYVPVRICFLYIGHNICVRCVSTMVVARTFRRSQMQLSMYDGTINIEDMIPNWIPYVATSAFGERASNMRVGIYASACTWNAMNNAFIVRASHPVQLGSQDFFSNDDEEKGKTEGRVQRFGISTFYADSVLMNPCW